MESLTSFLAVAVLEPSVFLKLPLVARLAQAGQTVAVTAHLHDVLRRAWKVASTDEPFTGSPFADSVAACTQHALNSDPPLKHTDLASSVLPGSTRAQLQSSLDERVNANPAKNAGTSVTNDHVVMATSPRKVRKPAAAAQQTRKSKRAKKDKTEKMPGKESAAGRGSKASSAKTAPVRTGRPPAKPKPTPKPKKTGRKTDKGERGRVADPLSFESAPKMDTRTTRSHSGV
jgi:hypothetical protein